MKAGDNTENYQYAEEQLSGLGDNWKPVEVFLTRVRPYA